MVHSIKSVGLSIVFSLGFWSSGALAQGDRSLSSRTTHTTPNLHLAQIGGDRPDFFEDGQDQFEEEIQRLERPSSDPTLSAQVPPEHWQDVSSRVGGFQVWMPMGALVKESMITPEIRDLEVTSFTHIDLASTFMVSYADITSVTDATPAELVDEVAAFYQSLVGAEVIEAEDITLDGIYPGKELELSEFLGALGGGSLTIRIYGTENRIYMLLVGGMFDPMVEDSAQTFLNSFHVIAD